MRAFSALDIYKSMLILFEDFIGNKNTFIVYNPTKPFTREVSGKEYIFDNINFIYENNGNLYYKKSGIFVGNFDKAELGRDLTGKKLQTINEIIDLKELVKNSEINFDLFEKAGYDDFDTASLCIFLNVGLYIQPTKMLETIYETFDKYKFFEFFDAKNKLKDFTDYIIAFNRNGYCLINKIFEKLAIYFGYQIKNNDLFEARAKTILTRTKELFYNPFYFDNKTKQNCSIITYEYIDLDGAVFQFSYTDLPHTEKSELSKKAPKTLEYFVDR